MPRPSRADEAGGLDHARNRGNLHAVSCHNDEGFAAFERILHEGLQRHEVQLFSYQLMPNHYQLVLRPFVDGEMSRFKGWVGGTHTMRCHAHVGVLTLHGVGSHDLVSECVVEPRTAIQDRAAGKARVAVRSVYYRGESPGHQAELWKEFDRFEDEDPSSLDQKIIQRLTLIRVGALAYANDPDDENSFYRKAQTKVRDALTIYWKN